MLSIDMSSVVMRVMVNPDFRQRLKLLAVAMDMSMGDLVQRIAESGETLEQLEKQYGIGEGKK